MYRREYCFHGAGTPTDGGGLWKNAFGRQYGFYADFCAGNGDQADRVTALLLLSRHLEYFRRIHRHDVTDGVHFGQRFEFFSFKNVSIDESYEISKIVANA